MIRSFTTLLACAILSPSLCGADEVAHFLRLNGTPEEDTAALDDPARFTDIPIEESVAFSGPVDSAAGNVITASGAFWSVGQFVFDAGDQPRHYFVEVTTGAAAGSRFDITANSGNTLTVDLAGGNLAGVGPGDEIRVVSKWSLDLLFPDGGALTPSTAAIRGTEILFPADGPGGVDYSGAASFQYRSDLGRWIDRNDPATDVGDLLIPDGSLMVIRQVATAPIRPLFTGFEATTEAPLKTTVSYLQAGSDNFGDAFSIGGEGTRAIDTLGASGETGEPVHAGNVSTASVWFRYSATQSGTITIRSEHSDYDTTLAAYSGTALANLQLLAANDDAPAATWSETSFSVTAGQDYYIALDGKNGASGAGNLTWEFGAGLPEITVEQPVNTSLVDGAATIDFGSVDQGSNSQRTFTIRNSGTAALTGLAATIDGTHQAEFAAGALSATTLQPGEAATFTVTFTPGAASLRTAALHVASNDADENPFDVDLSGTGTVPELPEIAVEQPATNSLVDGVATVDFGSAVLGANSQREFTIRNSGTAALTGLAATIDGTHQAEFAAGALSATTLQPGEAATFTVTFTPAAASLRTAALHVASNDADENPFDVALGGTGTEPPFIPDSPTMVMATDGQHQGEVRIAWEASDGATEYEVYRGTAEDGSDAVLVGSTGGTEFIDGTGNAGEDYYYFVKAKAGSETSDLSDGEMGHGTIEPPFRPDGLIGKKTSSLKGNNIYNTGSGQKITLASKNLKTLKWYFEIQNDGETADPLACRLTRKNNYFKVKLKTAAGANVTAAAYAGLLKEDLAGGETAGYKLEVKPTRKAKDKKKKRTFKFSIASGGDGSKQDTVQALAKTKK